jgi:nitroreductase
MEFMNVIKNRRSIRKYKPDPVPENVLNQILEAARLAPSDYHQQPWHFIIVKDPETKAKISIYSWAAEAPIIIVGCTDTHDSPRWHLVDFTCAFEQLVLAATNFDLGTCWIGILYRSREHEIIKELLGLPEHIAVVASTPLGYPAETPEPTERKTISEIAHYEKY